MIQQIEYFKSCLETNTVGSVELLSAESRLQYEEWLADEQVLLNQAHYQLNHRTQLEQASKLESDEEMIDAWIGGTLPPIHIYRVPFDFEHSEVIQSNFSNDVWTELQAIVDELREKYKSALKSGSIDHRHPLEPARAAWFKARVEGFRSENYPNEIPQTFADAECNIFGHVCPVFFAGEAATETSAARRRGESVQTTGTSSIYLLK